MKAPPQTRELAVYDGRDRIGLIVKHRDSVDAFDVRGVHLGTFANIKAAFAEVSCAPRNQSARVDGAHG